MSKPLELTIYPKNDVGFGEYYELENGWMTGIYAADGKARNKELTSADLAAEYWHSWNRVKTGSAAQRDWAEYDRSIILLRFGKAPHYDEVTT